MTKSTCRREDKERVGRHERRTQATTTHRGVHARQRTSHSTKRSVPTCNAVWLNQVRASGALHTTLTSERRAQENAFSTCPLTHSLTHSLTHPPTYLPTFQTIVLLIYLLNYLVTCLCSCFLYLFCCLFHVSRVSPCFPGQRLHFKILARVLNGLAVAGHVFVRWTQIVCLSVCLHECVSMYGRGPLQCSLHASAACAA